MRKFKEAEEIKDKMQDIEKNMEKTLKKIQNQEIKGLEDYDVTAMFITTVEPYLNVNNEKCVKLNLFDGKEVFYEKKTTGNKDDLGEIKVLIKEDEYLLTENSIYYFKGLSSQIKPIAQELLKDFDKINIQKKHAENKKIKSLKDILIKTVLKRNKK